MAGNKQLGNAKAAKNDEFYTQLADIQAEVNAYLDYDPDVFRGKTILLPCDDPEWSNFTRFFAQNFERFGLRKLVSTSYAFDSKNLSAAKNAKSAKRNTSFASSASSAAANPPFWQPTLFETEAPQYDAAKSSAHGKIFVLDRDTNGNGRVDFEDLEWKYLDGDGDFRSDEVRRLRDEADVIITNPPFSLFREFLAWIVEADKKFLIIGNMNAITYKEVFPLIKLNQLWLGATGFYSDMVFAVPKGAYVAPADKTKAERLGYIGDYTRLGNSCWFTNLDHGRRHKPLKLMTAVDNIKFSKHKEVRGVGYRAYDNYDAIEVPFTDAIPIDHDGIMGVPISFLDKYCPEQFEIVGVAKAGAGDPALKTKTYPEQIQVAKDGQETMVTKLNDGPVLKISEPPEDELYYKIGKELFIQVYARILIRHKKGTRK